MKEGGFAARSGVSVQVPPDYIRIRKIVQGAFGPRRFKSTEHQIEKIVARQLTERSGGTWRHACLGIPCVCEWKSCFGVSKRSLAVRPICMTRINIEQLRTFLAIVRLGGVRKAASGLNLTQPAVTARIKNLEETLGCDLFERRSGGMRLTERGELLLAHAERFEHLAELVERDVVDPMGIEGRLRLGVSETIAQCWLPELISRLHQLYPELEIEFNVDISVNLRAGVLNREVDLAILLGPVSEYSVNNIELPGFDLAWYASANAPIDVTEADFLSQPVLTYARNTRPYRELKEMLFERSDPDVSLFPSSSLSACFRLVAADLGVAVLPRALGQEHVEAGRIREFNPGWVPPPLRFTASYLGEPKSHLTETAAKIALEVATQYACDKNI